MANYCSNRIVFIGDFTTLKQELETMQKEYLKTDLLQIPGGYTQQHCNDGMFEIYITDETEDRLTVEYESRWTVSEDILGCLAGKHHLEFYGCFVPDDSADLFSGVTIGVCNQKGLIETCCFTIQELKRMNLKSKTVDELSKELYNKLKSLNLYTTKLSD